MSYARKSITQYRQDLRFETDIFERAKIYLELTRIYRVMVRMKNARLELMRAFKELHLPWPKNSFYACAKAYVYQNKIPLLHPDFEKRKSTEKINLLAELYEELGLSAYYLRHNFILLQSIILSRKICMDLGPSKPLLNWYGGAACVMSLIGLKKQGLKLIKSCHEISSDLQSPADHGKCLIWKALMYDYHGLPVRSAELFENCLQDSGKAISGYDLRLCVLTLSINYLTRGYYEKSVDTLKKLSFYNPIFEETQSVWLDSAAWYGLGAKAFLGETKEIQNMIQIFRSILSVDKDEKWLLAQFLGHLLIAGRKTKLDLSEVNDLIHRFNILGMAPKKTHFESCFYWIAEAYIRFDFAAQDKKHLPEFKKSLKKLSQVPRHPTINSHYAVLRAGLQWLIRDKSNYEKHYEQALEKARIIENKWALSELQLMQERVVQMGSFS